VDLLQTYWQRFMTAGVMPYFSNSNYRHGGKSLTVRSVQTIATLAAALLAITVASRAAADSSSRKYDRTEGESHLGIDQLAVDRLYGKGLLSRVESAADRRISIVALTPRGKKFLFFESTRIVAQVGVWIFGGKDFIIQGSGN